MDASPASAEFPCRLAFADAVSLLGADAQCRASGVELRAELTGAAPAAVPGATLALLPGQTALVTPEGAPFTGAIASLDSCAPNCTALAARLQARDAHAPALHAAPLARKPPPPNTPHNDPVNTSQHPNVGPGIHLSAVRHKPGADVHVRCLRL